jgi:hypothetical protein
MSALVGYLDYARTATVRTISSLSNINKIRILTFLQCCFTASKNNTQFSGVPSAKSAGI